MNFQDLQFKQAAKEEILFSKEIRDCLHGEKGRPRGRGFGYLMKMVNFSLLYIFSKIKVISICIEAKISENGIKITEY